jgi:hypothetical protein
MDVLSDNTYVDRDWFLVDVTKNQESRKKIAGLNLESTYCYLSHQSSILVMACGKHIFLSILKSTGQNLI